VSTGPSSPLPGEGKGDDLAAEIKVWVANMEEGTIDPFIGYPRDMAIYKSQYPGWR
jgi:hypothetical protein